MVGQGTPVVAVFTVADIKAECPRAGTEIVVVFKFRIAGVRDALDALRGALTALDTTIDDQRDPGEFNAALSKYYHALHPSYLRTTLDSEQFHIRMAQSSCMPCAWEARLPG